MPAPGRILSRPRLPGARPSPQAELLPMLPPSLSRAYVAPETIVGAARRPTEEFIAHVRQHGIITPLWVRPYGDGMYQLLGGRRRFWCAVSLGHPSVPVTIIDGEYNPEALALSDNALRADNIAADLAEIEVLLAQGHTVSAISKATGMAIETIKKRLRLGSLIPEFRAMLDRGELRTSIAEALARMGPTAQAAIYARVVAGEKLTGKVIANARRVDAGAQSTAVLDGFDDPDLDLDDNTRSVDRPLVLAAYRLVQWITQGPGVQCRSRETMAELRGLLDDLSDRLRPFLAVATDHTSSGTIPEEVTGDVE